MKETTKKQRQEIVDAIDDRIEQLENLLSSSRTLIHRSHCKLCTAYYKYGGTECRTCPARKMFGPLEDDWNATDSRLCLEFTSKATAIKVAIINAERWLMEQKEKILDVKL